VAHAASPGFFLPVRALSTIYRAKFRDAIERAGRLAEIPDTVWRIAWNVNCQAVGDAANTLAYLARYVFKVAISEHRILSVNDTHVRFAYTVPSSHRRRTMALPVQEFIRRFLQHVLPTGFVKVRHYGFLSPNFRMPIAAIKARVEMAYAFALKPLSAAVALPAPKPMTCTHCGDTMKLVRMLRPAKLGIHAISDCTAPAALSATRCAAGP
jgi:hypothetical protein